MFCGDDEEGDFLSPSRGTKLASLFGLAHGASQENESFQYTAPKQPKKGCGQAASDSKKPAQSPGTPVVLLASAVQAYKYVDGKYVKQGKLGAAVLGCHKTNEYKLLLYLSQQKQVTAAKLHVGFILTVQPNNYCTFYDDQRQNWSLMFQTEKMAIEFYKEVCLAKANSATSLDSVVTQDLILGEGQSVGIEDSVELLYTGWLLQNHTFGKIFDSNQNTGKLLRLKMGSGKVLKGWEEGMQGMKKTGHRLIVIPPFLAYGSGGVPNRIPPNSTLIFETELRRVRISKDSGSDQAGASFTYCVTPFPASSPSTCVESQVPEHPSPAATFDHNGPGELPMHIKSNPLSEQLTNPDTSKAKLISRMAKMGQPMLPFLTGAANPPESGDSDFEDANVSRANDCSAPPSPVQLKTTTSASDHVHPHPHNAPTTELLSGITHSGPELGLPDSSHPFQPYYCTKTPTVPSQKQTSGQIYLTQTLPFIGSADMNSFLITEARQHQAEIRLAIGKVADKVDHLTLKIDDIQRHPMGHPMNVSCMSMETSVIMHNIQRIIQENEYLKKEVFKKNSCIEDQNHEIGDLINQNQRYMEQSQLLMEQRSDSLKSCTVQNQARLLQAEQDKVCLAEDLASSAAQISQLELECSAHQQKVLELQSKLSLLMQDKQNCCQQITALETQLEGLRGSAESTQIQYRLEKQRCNKMQQRFNTLETELQDLKTYKEQQDRLQAEVEEYKVKYEQTLALSQEQHSKEVAQLTEQRNALQDKLTQLQEKSCHPEIAVTDRLQRRVTDPKREAGEQTTSRDLAAEVKHVMNGVFHSLRAEFDASETYSGQTVLKKIIFTIKNVTLQMLSDAHRSASKPSTKEKEAENDERESEDVKQRQDTFNQKVDVNEEREVREEKRQEEYVGDSNSNQIGTAQINPEVKENKEAVPESEIPSRTDTSPCFYQVLSTEHKPQEPQTVASESKAQQKTGQHSDLATSSEEECFKKAVDPHNRPEERSFAEGRQERNVSETSEVKRDGGKDEESAEDGAASQKLFEPPAKPPPPPNTPQQTSTDGISVTGRKGGENGRDQCVQMAAPATVSTEEDETNLKGCPPPSPMFDDEENDDDRDWLN